LLVLMNTPADIFADAESYITIICWGLFTVVVYNLSASLLRAIGNSKIPLYFLVVSAVLNIVLDIVFIAFFNTGVAGAAWATVISQGVSGGMCILYIVLKVPMLHIEPKHLRLDFELAKAQLSVGIPMSLQYSITSIGIIFVQSTLNCLGTTAIAAYNTANKLENVITQPFPAMGVTLANYCAQNKGVNDFARIKEGVKKGFLISNIYAVGSAVVINLIVPFVIPLFTNGDLQQMISYSQTFIFLDSLFFVPLGLIFVFRESLQGTGYAFMPMMAGLVELASRFTVSLIAKKYLSFGWVCLANGITWLVTGIFIGAVYFVIMKRSKDGLY
ncbi:MAG: MATE family efflux transporter, partial [Oscillospiraceae bacterium]